MSYDPTRDRLLVVVSGSVPVLGNSLVELNPHTGALGRQVFVGTAPDVVAVSGDGSRAYVGLVGSPAIVEVDLATFTLTRTIDLGTSGFLGPNYAEDIAVQPGNPGVIAVSRRNACCSPRHTGVAVYENGVKRTNETPTHTGPNRITWSDDPAVLYGFNNETSGFGIYTLTVDASGVVVSGTASVLSGYANDIVFGDGLIHANGGQVVDPVSMALVGAYTTTGSVVVDAAQRKAFFLNGGTLSRHSTATQLQDWSRSVPNISPYDLVDAGTVLAAAGSSSVLLMGLGVSASAFAAPSAPPLASQMAGAHSTSVAAQELAPSPDGVHVFGVVGQSAASYPGEVLEIDASTGAVGRHLFVGADPNKIAVSSDGSTLLIGHNAATKLTEVDVSSFTARRSILLGTSEFAGDIAPQPGASATFAVQLYNHCCSPYQGATILVRDGVVQPSKGGGGNGPTSVAFGASPDRLYGYDGGSSSYGFHTMAVDATGLHPLSAVSMLIQGYGRELTSSEGLVYASDGSVVDPTVPRRIGTTFAGGQIVPVPALGRLLAVSGTTITESDLRGLWTIGSRTYSGGSAIDAALVGSTVAIATSSGTVVFVPLDLDPPPPPAVTGLLPTAVPLTGGAVTVHGTGFNGASGVRVAGETVPFVVVDDNTITLTAPPRAAGAVTVTVSNTGGTSSGGPLLTYTGPTGASYQPVAPVRILDSRSTTGGWSGKLAAGAPRTLTVIGGLAAVPVGAVAIVANVTVTNPSAASYLRIAPAGASTEASSLNYGAGQTIANLVTVKVGTGGQVSFANAVGATDVVVDLVGYYAPLAADRHNAVAPARILDSRTPVGGWGEPLVANAPRTVYVDGVAGVPPTADALVVHVAVTGGTANSYLTAYPAGSEPPLASTVNFAAGETAANLAVVKVGLDRRVAFFNAAGSVHVVVDVVGYFDPTTGDVFHPVDPARALDSRSALGGWGSTPLGGTPRILVLAGTAPVGADATAVVGNLAVTGPSASSFLTVYPSGIPTPFVSSLNFAAGETRASAVSVKVGGAGAVTFANATGNTHVVLDLVGYYAPT